MSPLDSSTDFDDAGAGGWHASPSAPGLRCSARGIIVGTIMLPALASLVAAAAWLFWTLASGAMGSRGAVLTVVALVAAAAMFSWRTGQSFASSLIIVASAVFILLLAVLVGVAGYGLMFGRLA
jgi:hypothetical protein